MTRFFVLSKLLSRFSRLFLLGFSRLVVFSFILLFAQNVYSAQVTFDWDPNTQPDIAGYVVYTGSSSRVYDVSVDVGNQTTYTLSGLADGQTYCFAVTAYDTYGSESNYSEELSWTSPPPNGPPVASDGSLTTLQNTLASGTLSASDPDGDGLTYSLVSAGSLGVATFADPATGVYIYTPNRNATGTDTFSFKVNDGTVDSNVATVTVTITQTVDTDGDGIPDDDETDIYGTDPNNADTDGDGINDGDELAYWGDMWNTDYDGDGTCNLLDPDADGDSVSDGEEINQGFDPADPNSKPQPPSSVKIWLEAEEGDLYTPMEIACEEEASSDEYIEAPNSWALDPTKDGGYAEYTFEVPEAGDYVIWGRLLAIDSGSDSFFVSMDNGQYMLWHVQNSETWIWDPVSIRNVGDVRDGSNPAVYYLEAGVHTLTIRQREPGTKLDKILVTNDVEYVPEGLDEDSAVLPPAKIWLEAEEGDLYTPMEIADDEEASSDEYIEAPNGWALDPTKDAGYAEYTFEVPEAGDYVIWGRTLAGDLGSDSFFVSMDNGEYALWHVQNSETWVWDPVSIRSVEDVRDASNPAVYYLEAGVHTLTIRQREPGTKLDKILVTNDRVVF